MYILWMIYEFQSQVKPFKSYLNGSVIWNWKFKVNFNMQFLCIYRGIHLSRMIIDVRNIFHTSR